MRRELRSTARFDAVAEKDKPASSGEHGGLLEERLEGSHRLQDKRAGPERVPSNFKLML